MKKNQDVRRAKNLKLTVTDGWAIRKITALELSQLAGISKQHAYKLIADPDSIRPGMWELLRLKLLGAVPGFEPGWYVTEDGIKAPNGFTYSQHDLEHYGFAVQVARNYRQDMQTLEERIEWLRRRLSTPDKLRKYSSPKVVQFKHLKAAGNED